MFQSSVCLFCCVDACVDAFVERHSGPGFVALVLKASSEHYSSRTRTSHDLSVISFKQQYAHDQRIAAPSPPPSLSVSPTI